MHNIGTMVVVNVSEFGEQISMTGKMMDVKTGSVFWMGEGSGDLKKGLGTIGGALVGAGIGGGVGNKVGGTQGAVVGAVGGGAVGAVAGSALEPNQAKLARSVISKTCKNLPDLNVKH